MIGEGICSDGHEDVHTTRSEEGARNPQDRHGEAPVAASVDGSRCWARQDELAQHQTGINLHSSGIPPGCAALNSSHVFRAVSGKTPKKIGARYLGTLLAHFSACKGL